MVKNAKIALLDMNLQKAKMSLGVQIVVEDPDKIEEIKRRYGRRPPRLGLRRRCIGRLTECFLEASPLVACSEADLTKEKIEKILAAGANVVLTTKGIDDLCLKYFIDAGAMAVRRCKKEDLERIAKATGGTLVSTLATLEGEEAFDPAYLGYAEEVAQERISDDELVRFCAALQRARCWPPGGCSAGALAACPASPASQIFIKGPKQTGASSIILRGANEFMLDEMERSIHDALCVIKRTLESNRVVPGGGCVEAAVSIFLENFATTLVRCARRRARAGGSAVWLSDPPSFSRAIDATGLARAAGHLRVCTGAPGHSKGAPPAERRTTRARSTWLTPRRPAWRPAWRTAG